MRDFITGGRILDVIIALTVVEAAVLILWRGRAWAVVSHLAAGAFLVLAFRLHTLGAAWPWIAACLAAAGATHIWDMVRSLTRSPGSSD